MGEVGDRIDDDGGSRDVELVRHGWMLLVAMGVATVVVSLALAVFERRSPRAPVAGSAADEPSAVTGSAIGS